MAINLCSRCYVFEMRSCDQSSLFTVTMPENETTYTFWITDKFGNYWLYTNTSSNVGDLELPLAVFPEGYFTEYSGSFEVNVSTSDVTNNPETFTINDVEYDCFIFKFVKTTVL